jgi:hypothetical protein
MNGSMTMRDAQCNRRSGVERSPRARQEGPSVHAIMVRKRRKTLIVCAPCHDWIHANPVASRHKSLESPVPGKRARRVWWEAAWKRPEFMRNEHGTSPGSPPYWE